MRFSAFLFLLLAGPAVAQEPAQTQKPEPRKERGETTLNLKLDESSGSRGVIQFEPRDRLEEKKADGGLPSMGENARTLQSEPSASPRSPFPKDTETGYR